MSPLLSPPRSGSNVRELEGALLATVSSVVNYRVAASTRSLLTRSSRNLVSATPQGFSIESIQREVATYFDISWHDLRGPSASSLSPGPA